MGFSFVPVPPPVMTKTMSLTLKRFDADSDDMVSQRILDATLILSFISTLFEPYWTLETTYIPCSLVPDDDIARRQSI